MAVHRSPITDIRSAGLISSVVAAGAGMWMVAVALCGDDGLLRLASPPATIAPMPELVLAATAADYTDEAPTLTASIRALSGEGHDTTVDALGLARGDPRQQLMDAVNLLRRREASPDRPPPLLVPSSPPPRRSGDQ